MSPAQKEDAKDEEEYEFDKHIRKIESIQRTSDVTRATVS
jgi:hypothetical protein